MNVNASSMCYRATDESLPKIGVALLSFVGAGVVFLVDAALGLVLFSGLAVLFVFLNLTYALWFLPLVILLRNSDLSGFGASDGNILVLSVVAGIVLFSLRFGRFKFTPIAFFAFMAGIFIVLSAGYHLAFGDPDIYRIIRYSILALSGGVFVASIDAVDDSSIRRILSPVPVVVVLLVLIIVNLVYSWSTHGWYWGGRISVRLSPTDTINTALPMLMLWLLAFWRLGSVRGRVWYFTLCVLLVGIAAIALTGARAVMVALLVGVLVPYSVNFILYISKHSFIRVRAMKALGLIFTGALIAGFILYQGFLSEYADGFRIIQNPMASAMSRLDIWLAWIGELNGLSIWTGVGVGGEAIVGSHPHSAYFGVLVYSGVIAFLFVCLLLVFVGASALKQRNAAALGVFTAASTVFMSAVQPDRPDLWFAIMLMVALLRLGRRTVRVKASIYEEAASR